MRESFLNEPRYMATVNYIFDEEGYILLQRFKTKWENVYSGFGGKTEGAESLTICTHRENKEECGLKLINPILKGIVHWISGKQQGHIAIYLTTKTVGKISICDESSDIIKVDPEALTQVPQFEMNSLFAPFLFKNGTFEASFEIDEENKVKSGRIFHLTEDGKSITAYKRVAPTVVGIYELIDGKAIQSNIFDFSEQHYCIEPELEKAFT